MASTGPSSKTPLRFVDIAINLTDSMYSGVYHGKEVHEADTDEVIKRALDIGCSKLIVSGTDLEESKKAVELARRYPGICYATIGVHPCSANTFEKSPSGPGQVLSELKALALSAKEDGVGVMFGEIGLDGDRLEWADMETQKTYFARQLELIHEIQLPLFLHSRAAHGEFRSMLRDIGRLDSYKPKGVVHSFTGTLEEMQELIEMGLDIGVNGCSLKTQENLDVVKMVPLERLHLETDGPWCDIRASHASSKYLSKEDVLPKAVKKEKFEKRLMVKSRNEPCTIVQVARVVAGIKGVSMEEVCEAAWKNAHRLFNLGDAA